MKNKSIEEKQQQLNSVKRKKNHVDESKYIRLRKTRKMKEKVRYTRAS